MSRGVVSYLSFLDLVCCAFGAAVLMFLIAVTAAPSSRPEEGVPALLVSVRHVDGPRAEVALEYRRPGNTRWEHPGPGDPTTAAFAATSEPQSGAESFVLLFAPEPGVWEFRAFQAQFAAAGQPRGVMRVELHAAGDGVRVEGKSLPFALAGPGDEGPVLRVHVSRSR